MSFSQNPIIEVILTRNAYRRHQVTEISTTFNTVEITAHSYYFDDLGRATNAVRSIQPLSLVVTNLYAYNARSEVVVAGIDTNEFAYIYDNIGNNLYTSLNSVTNAYTINNLNQYSSLQPEDLQPINLSYDLDGNMLTNGVWSFTYDAENRMSATYSNDTLLASNTYDHLSRRIRKAVSSSDHCFIYDGWNLIHERVAHTNGTIDEIEYVWGLDLSGTSQGAGGVGGLLFEKRNGAIYIPCYDANGNITAYIDESGVIRAYRVYDAFGNTVAKGGDMVDAFHFWYSTKYLDHDTGLYYYGYRYYSPMLQRWVNRDPIEEDGGNNLYNFNENSAFNNIDMLGLAILDFTTSAAKGNPTRIEPERPTVKMKIESSNDFLANKFCYKLILESVTMHVTIYQGHLLKLGHETLHVKDYKDIAFNKTVEYAQSKEKELYATRAEAECWKHAAEEFVKLVFHEEATYTTIVNVDFIQKDMWPGDLGKYKKQAADSLGMWNRFKTYLKNKETKCNSLKLK